MLNAISRYTQWLHTRWPAGTLEKLPAVNPDGSTNIRGVYVVGDLTGVPLLKFAADSGAACIDQIEQDLPRKDELGLYDVVIVGAGIAGCSAAIEAKKRGLKYCLLEASQAFSTIRELSQRETNFRISHGHVASGRTTL